MVMNIVFNLCNVGLGNNGGSRTVIRSAEALAALGNNVTLFSDVKSRYRWHEIDSRVRLEYGTRQPRCDVSIATGFKSVPHVLRAKAKRKFYYIRGFETWQANKKHLFQSYKQLNCIVNSSWLARKLKSGGVEAKVIYAGLDLDDFKNLGMERQKMFGALFSKKHATKRHIDAEDLSVKTGLQCEMLNRHIKSPNHYQLNEWYNKLKVWFAPTELEGFHNPPSEAGLAGCALVCTDASKSGMDDYAVHNETALVYPARNLNVAKTYVEALMNDDQLRESLASNLETVLREKIGSRQKNMNLFSEYISG